eukprot:TRINITY_DN10463_c0_g1_i1.p2 TRINITY_DN10463_c0_g1~~TRINITY_DN10463_c0_g1_i1.p2  ORF type:complete len:176 (-),score=22.62 TRINITY_DN10463_c0_g1_i1:351-878(-)
MQQGSNPSGQQGQQGDVLERLVGDIDNQLKKIEKIQKTQQENNARNYFQHVLHQLRTKPNQTLGVLFWSFGAITTVLALRYDYLYKYYHHKFSTEIGEFQEERERLSDEIFHLRDQIKKLKADVRGELPHSLDMQTLRDNVMVAMGFRRRPQLDVAQKENNDVSPIPPPNPSAMM